jgi:energy-converting hydrogenase Eha subunit F
MAITANFIFIWSAVIAGFASAGLWYRAATVVIKKGDARAANDIFLGGVAIQTTARVQSQYNQYAAGMTALSVLLQTITQFFNHW